MPDQLQLAVAAQQWGTVGSLFQPLTVPNKILLAARIVGAPDGSGGFPLVPIPVDAPIQDPRVLRAARLIHIGWDVRTAARAKYVSQEQFTVLHDYLVRAERILIDITAREPDNISAWEQRLTTARGLSLGQAEARRRYTCLAKYDPHNYSAQSCLLQQLCPKWGGSFEEAHTFARERMLAAPEGALSGVLVAQAHAEHWLELPADEREIYLRQPEIRDEVIAAASRSVLHPDCRPGQEKTSGHGAFAMILSLIGDHAAAAPHFRNLAEPPTGMPWCYLDDHMAAFQRHRAAALARG